MVLKRKDGTFVIEGIGGSLNYHVIESDPLYQSVLDRLADGEEWQWDIPKSPGEGWEWDEDTWEWKPTMSVISKNLGSECDKHLENVLLQNGFPWAGYTIRCDSVSQQNATGFMTAITAGLNPFPIVWRTVENVNISFQNVEEFKPFAETMMGFINMKFQEKWAVKDAITAAGTEEEANQIYQGYVGG